MKTTGHVPHPLALLHLYLWEIITSVSRTTLGLLNPSGTWMILCGTHWYASRSPCCDRGGPWFTTTLYQEVRDDIHVCWCKSGIGEDVGVEVLEIYIILASKGEL